MDPVGSGGSAAGCSSVSLSVFLVLHEDLAVVGCSDSDGEMTYTLDGEEKWYADFKKGKGVDPPPDFIGSFRYQEGVYEQAVANQQVCRSNLKVCRIGMKDIPVEKGKEQ